MQESPKRKVLIHETLPGRDLKQKDMSGKCLVGSTVNKATGCSLPVSEGAEYPLSKCIN